MVNSELFTKRLQKIMDEYDLNATSFADAIDVGRSSISHIISGRNKPSLEFVMKIIEAFPEVELYWLLNGKGSFPKGQVTKRAPIVSSQLAANFDDEPVALASNSTDASSTTQPTPDTSPSTKSDIERIVIFYKDGTFKSFNP
ncbi:helix-turn-helix domain-containing protein [Leeuwenhoekiella palythoae]|uniref:helix-turn-helix domain-containing protein n=1 Tax=Leeuwenhoekiella palythoae TaxID=573501 RepID=UPI003512D718